MIRVILLFLIALPVSARDWYLSTAGNDSAACTRSAPCINVNGHAGYTGPAHVLAAGDRVIFRGGETFTNSLLLLDKSNLTVISGHLLSPKWGDSKAKIKSTTEVGYGIVVGNSSNVVLRGLDVSYPFLSGSNYDAGIRVVAGTGLITRNVTIDDVFVHDSPMGVRFPANVIGATIKDSRFENNSTPVDLCPRFPSGVDVTDSSNVVITHNEFINNGFNSCENAQWVGGRGLTLVSSGPNCNPCAENITVTDNVFTYPFGPTIKPPDSPAFIEGFYAKNVTVERNRFLGNGVFEVKQQCNNWTIRNNIFDLPSDTKSAIQWGVFPESPNGPILSDGLVMEQNTFTAPGVFFLAQLQGINYKIHNNLFKFNGGPVVTPILIDNRANDFPVATSGEIRGNVIDAGTTIAGQLTDAGQVVWPIGSELVPTSANSQTAFTIGARYLPSPAVYGRGIAKPGTDMYLRPFLTSSQVPGAVEPRGTVELNFKCAACAGAQLQYSSDKGTNWINIEPGPLVVEQPKNQSVCYRARWLTGGTPSNVTRDQCVIVDDLGKVKVRQ